MTDTVIDKTKKISLKISLSYHDDLVNYVDHFYVIKTNLWHDYFPAKFDYQIKRAKLGQTLSIDYAPAELLYDEFSQNNLITIPIYEFHANLFGPIAIHPGLGRFYPRGLIHAMANCFPEDLQPFRILNKTAKTLDVDLNHPLINFPIQLTATIHDVFDGKQPNGGRCQDIADMITNDGPGMQCLLASDKADYFYGMPFSRTLENDDSEFYDAIETVPSVDLETIKELKDFYARYLKDDTEILDLMCADTSYLPDNISCQITGLGVKEKDLMQNNHLKEKVIHNVNSNPLLPFSDNQFDHVISSFAIEYVTQPFELFKQIAKILKTGGTFSIAFSDRFFKQKAIAIWQDVHPFERMGIVLEYFRDSELFTDLVCESVRGNIRSEDDPFKSKDAYSCPVFLLNGTKK